MSIKITCPKNDTNIQLNVSGKSVKEGYAERQIADTLSKVEPINTKI